MRIGIIGSGTQAQQHAAALAKLKDVEIAAIGSRQPANACGLAERIGVPARSPQQVLSDPKIEAIVIATPTATHREFVCAAFAEGKHVFCEYPIAHSLADAEAMIDAATRAARILQIGMIHRFDPPYLHLIGMIRAVALGNVLAIETTRLSAHSADGAQKSHHGDAIDELLTFDLHFLHWAFGRPRSLRAQTVDVSGRSRHVVAAVEYPNLIAACTASSFLPAGYPFTEQTRVFAERGHVELRLRLSPKSVEWTYEISKPNSLPDKIPIPDDDPTVEQMRHFTDLASGRVRENRADARVARDLLELTLAAAKAARSGDAVRFDRD